METLTSAIPPGIDPNLDFRFYIAWYCKHTARQCCSTLVPMAQPLMVDRRERIGGEAAGESKRFWRKGI
jgi:hypothetical protein